MKSAAIVLGLALAANAQVDNELASTLPYNPSGADLVRNAGWGRSQPIHVPPKHTNPTYWSKNDDATDDELMVYYTKDSQGNKHYEGGYTVRRDDAADDELVQTFYSPSGADLVKYAKQSQQTVYRPTAHVVRDDADDEFMVYYTKDSRGVNQYQGGYTRRDDAADDELRAIDNLPRDEFGRVVRPPYARFDEQADDELVQTFYSPSGADLVKYAKQSQQTVYRPTAHVVRDDADDELMVYYTKDSQGNKHYEGGYTVRRDDAADDELVQTFYSPSGADLVKYAKQSQQTVYRPTAHVVRDDADDELVQTFYSPSGADLVKYAKQSQQTVYRPTAHVVRDDELSLIPVHPRVFGEKGLKKPAVVPTSEALIRDDEADDELVQTFYSPSGADLVKYAKQSQQTVYRPTAHVVRDDELSLIPVHPRVFGEKGLKKPAVVPTSEALIRDDEADDELAYLGQLIRHAENDRIAPLRTFDDDELRVEKPSHVKAQEKAEMKAELPKMKRKLRPADETAFLA